MREYAGVDTDRRLYQQAGYAPSPTLNRTKRATLMFSPSLAIAACSIAVIEKIIEGKLGSFYELVCLLDQPSIRDPKATINTMLQAAIAKLGENISVARFVRFKVGEGA